MKNCEKPLASALVMLVYDYFAFSFLSGVRANARRMHSGYSSMT